MKYDYLVVGCGLFGATFAQKMIEAGKSVLILDKKSHVGGTCYTEKIKGINVHKYGAHIFHTSDEEV
jgi:UDP-galactopyranose mutase